MTHTLVPIILAAAAGVVVLCVAANTAAVLLAFTRRRKRKGAVRVGRRKRQSIPPRSVPPALGAQSPWRFD